MKQTNSFGQFKFDLQIFEGQLLNFMDEELEEWEWRERLHNAGLPLSHWRLVKELSKNGKLED